MLGRGLINRAVATFVAAGAGFVAMVALGATVYYLLLLAVPPVIASALTALLFALIAAIVALVFVRRARGDEEEEEEEPEGLGARALHLFQQRPVLGAVAALAGGFIFLRNPALATMVAAAFTEKSRVRRRR
jgi:cytosine/adenosine deaminase-related metal-dependent hydrolase